MRHAIAALVSMVLVVALTIGGFFAMKPEPAQAQTLINCELVVGQQARVICTLAGETLLNTVVDLPTVTLPPLPQATVTAPGATVTLAPPTVTVTPPLPPRATETVRVNVPVPGPTSTVTVEVPTDGSTATVTLPPKPGKTVTETVKPDGKPVPTVTETATVEVESSTGQTTPESGTVEPSSEDNGFFTPEIDLGDRTITAGETGLGLLGLLLIFATVVGGMFYGFRRGQLTRETDESNFLRAMLDRSKTE